MILIEVVAAELDGALAKQLLRDHFTVSTALIALMLKNLPHNARTRTLDAVRNGTGKVELRTRVESSETKLVLVPTDGSEPLWRARCYHSRNGLNSGLIQ